MDVIASVRDYVHKMVSEVVGLKALLVDKETSGMVGMVYSRSAILRKEVFLMDLLSKPDREKMQHLKCVVFVRPTTENITTLCTELRSPKYGEYHVFFSNIVSRDFLHSMALADEEERVKQVQEFYGDFYAINKDLFTLNIDSCAPLMRGQWDQKLFDRMTSGILAVLLAMKRRPVMRYQAKSTLCERLANNLKDCIKQESALFDFRARDNCLLLLLDRREDPVTPILTQWTYQAMIHELFGITNNRVVINASKKKAGPSSDGEASDNEVVLSGEQDLFFEKNMFSNWGDLCLRLKQFVDEFKAKSDQTSNIQSIEEMKNFMRDYPKFREMSGNVSKHVNLVGEMSERINERDLLNVSVLEQEMACYDEHSKHYEKLVVLLQNPKTKGMDCLRLVLLYALRYEGNKANALPELKKMLQAKGVPPEKVLLVDTIIKYGGTKERQSALFQREGITRVMTNIARGFKDVNNVYTQHEPPMKNILEKITSSSSIIPKNRSTDQFPFVSEFAPPHGGSQWKPKEVIIFVVGGATYEEALFVNAFNEPPSSNTGANATKDVPKGKEKESNPNQIRYILGSNCMLNSETFLREVEDIYRAA
uniref:Uncharacterized protein n=1 Tax=Eutreptiella gymnastica TaxID=73025 RepID=A0A7S4LBG7_9EUGL